MDIELFSCGPTVFCVGLGWVPGHWLPADPVGGKCYGTTPAAKVNSEPGDAQNRQSECLIWPDLGSVSGEGAVVDFVC